HGALRGSAEGGPSPKFFLPERHKCLLANVKGTWPPKGGRKLHSSENGRSRSANFVSLKVRPGQRDEARRVWEKYVRDHVAGSNGTLSYYYCYDDTDPDTIIVFGLAADQASTQEFMKQPWFADYQRETAPLLAGPAEVRR